MLHREHARVDVESILDPVWVHCIYFYTIGPRVS